jgi:hypothetical protein
MVIIWTPIPIPTPTPIKEMFRRFLRNDDNIDKFPVYLSPGFWHNRFYTR